MTPSACVMIRRCAGLLAARRLRAVRLHRAIWAASRRNGSRHPRTSAIADLSGRWIDVVHGRRPPRSIVLDMDSSVSPTHGEQEMSVWNGITPAPATIRCSCSTSSVISNAVLCVPATCTALTAGTTCSSTSWRYQGKVSRIYFRADAAFAMPEVYEFLEAERIKYAIRPPANQVPQSRIGYLLKRPVERPAYYVRRCHASFSYQAGS